MLTVADILNLPFICPLFKHYKLHYMSIANNVNDLKASTVSQSNTNIILREQLLAAIAQKDSI